MEELHEDQKAVLQSKIASNQIILERLDGNELGNVTSILSQTKSLSLVDCSVYYFSSKLKATLLTGDSALRKFAENKKLEVRGILWIFDEFQAKGLVNGTMLAEKLQFLTTINTRLPKTECEKRIELWK
ncbi:MAG: hypothetical protein Q8903_14280 [Bacteroidota bacterium]|nr:hypothetical protein [Bacteroidota bacterium]